MSERNHDGTIIAMMGLDQWRMHLPVKAGDTIHAVITPTEKADKQRDEGNRNLRTNCHKPAQRHRSFHDHF